MTKCGRAGSAALLASQGAILAATAAFAFAFAFAVSITTNTGNALAGSLLFPVGSPGLMLGAHFTIVDYLLWNEIPTVLGNLVGGLLFVGAALYSTHYKTAPKRVPASPVGVVARKA